MHEYICIHMRAPDFLSVLPHTAKARILWTLKQNTAAVVCVGPTSCSDRLDYVVRFVKFPYNNIYYCTSVGRAVASMAGLRLIESVGDTIVSRKCPCRCKATGIYWKVCRIHDSIYELYELTVYYDMHYRTSVEQSHAAGTNFGHLNNQMYKIP